MLNSRKTAVSSPRKKAERKKSGGLGEVLLIEFEKPVDSISEERIQNWVLDLTKKKDGDGKIVFGLSLSKK